MWVCDSCYNELKNNKHWEYLCQGRVIKLGYMQQTHGEMVHLQQNCTQYLLLKILWKEIYLLGILSPAYIKSPVISQVYTQRHIHKWKLLIPNSNMILLKNDYGCHRNWRSILCTTHDNSYDVPIVAVIFKIWLEDVMNRVIPTASELYHLVWSLERFKDKCGHDNVLFTYNRAINSYCTLQILLPFKPM